MHCDVEGVHSLLGRAQKLCPGLGQWQLDDAWAGLRPTTTDGAPVRISASRRVESRHQLVSISRWRGSFLCRFRAVSDRAGLRTHKVVEFVGLRRLLEEWDSPGADGC